jgi:hypothetical protein
MKSLLVGMLLVANWMMPSLSSSPSADLPTLYVLNNPQSNQWCGYLNEKIWRSDIDEYGALKTASVEFHETHPRLVKLTEADNPEAGDWIAYDTYSLGDDGAVVSLRRITNVLPGDVSRTEIFERHNGKLTRSGVTMKSLRSGRSVIPGKLWFPNRPLISDTGALPFSALLHHAQDIRGDVPVCVESPKSDPSRSAN